MAMSELKRKLILNELAQMGFPGAAYIPESDLIKVQPDNDRMPKIYDDGSVTYGAEHRDFALNVLKPVVDRISESMAAWDKARDMPFEDLSKFRVLAEYNGIMLAARDDTGYGRGLHFVTWQYNHDRTGLDHGHYTENYNAAKEDFAVRSGFVPEDKLLTPEQVTYIKEALQYRIDNDGDLSYEDEYELFSTITKLNAAYSVPGSEAGRGMEQADARETAEQDYEEPILHTADAAGAAGADTPYNEKQSALLERIGRNLGDYRSMLDGFGSQELIDMAAKISAWTDAHDFMQYHAFADEELDYLLQFQNPLEVVADAWNDRLNENDGMGDFLYNLCDRQDGLSDYPLMKDAKAQADPGLHRFMGVDVIDFLGGIAEKFITRYPGAWKFDIDELRQYAMILDTDTQRLVWQVSAEGAYLRPERDVFIKDSAAYQRMTDCRRDDPDMLGYFVEITDRNGQLITGNVFEAGNYAEFAKHVTETALPLESVSLTYSGQWGENAGRVITVSRQRFDDERERLMVKSGKVIDVMPLTRDEQELLNLIQTERAARVAYPIGSIDAHLRTVADKLAEISDAPDAEHGRGVAVLAETREKPERAADKPKPKTLAEKMQAANEKVKAQDAPGSGAKSHKREERE